ncbi:MAG: Gfo/Idh/MocA family oxidoreductase [Blautia sp.]|nr:Gfo/Idh/MocA family oxidoreductase [Blautia sp.]
MKLRIGIIGCGMITKNRHAPEYAENPSCELVAFYDRDRQRAEALAKQYGAAVCDTVEELLALDLDAVSVCTANAFHADISVKALNAGKHVLCEKPMAMTLEECLQMTEAADKNGKILMIGQNQRFAKAHQEARKLIAEGAIGKILSFETKFGHGGPEIWTSTPNTWFFDKKQAVFGVMADLGIHKIDLMHYLMGEQITSVQAIMTILDKKWPDGRMIDVDDNAFCLLQTDSGITGIMHVSWTFYGNEKNSAVIYGTEGVIRCYDDDECSLIYEKKGGETIRYNLEKILKNTDATRGDRASTGVIDEFVDSILNSREPLCSGKESLKAMRVVFAAAESAKSGNKVHI